MLLYRLVSNLLLIRCGVFVVVVFNYSNFLYFGFC